jgi:hypothetical protein
MDELKTKTNNLNKPKEEEKIKEKEKSEVNKEKEIKKLDSIFDSDPTMDDIFSVQKSMIHF